MNRRTIHRGEQQIDAAPPEPNVIEIELRIPEFRSGLRMRAALTIELISQTEDKIADLTRSLTICSREPFANQKRRLEKLNIQLFAPEEKCPTRGVLTKTGIPFKEIHNLAAIEGLSEGTLLIAEGISFELYPGLFPVAATAAENGTRVLFLAPADGAFEMPGAAENKAGQPDSISLRKNSIITDIEKTLDAESWPPRGKLVQSSFRIEAWGQRVTMKIIDGPGGWPWFEAVYPSKGRLILLGFPIVESWGASPNPRYLMLKILERLHP